MQLCVSTYMFDIRVVFPFGSYITNGEISVHRVQIRMLATLPKSGAKSNGKRTTMSCALFSCACVARSIAQRIQRLV